MARVDEEAVVGALDGDGRQGAGVARFAGHHLAAPAGLHVLEEVDAVFLLGGENDIQLAVAIEIQETCACVLIQDICKPGPRR
jgi:hypothetical protein